VVVSFAASKRPLFFPRPLTVTLYSVSTGLYRYQNTRLPHFITFSCARHRPILGTSTARDTFCELLERTRELYLFHILGYVIMPDHVHLLLTEPEEKRLSIAIQILKQRYSKLRNEDHVWEPRYYDFNIHTEKKRVEKLRYIHRNPVRRELVEKPEDWRWSSYCDYAGLARGPVTVTLPSW
jgi:putative transposase